MSADVIDPEYVEYFLREQERCEEDEREKEPQEDAEWQAEALQTYDDALRRREMRNASVACRDSILACGRVRLHRARSSLGGGRRPRPRRSARSASRSAGGGESDDPGPAERGAKYTAAYPSADRSGLALPQTGQDLDKPLCTSRPVQRGQDRRT